MPTTCSCLQGPVGPKGPLGPQGKTGFAGKVCKCGRDSLTWKVLICMHSYHVDCAKSHWGEWCHVACEPAFPECLTPRDPVTRGGQIGKRGEVGIEGPEGPPGESGPPGEVCHTGLARPQGCKCVRRRPHPSKPSSPLRARSLSFLSYN